mmetsp:Transcript_22662/g.75176  ORF Transcript_22662/g.75176 Transcript_22662/m.75176 type:complete len:295 (-) Transcript_22662:19-903(-)
MPLLPSLAPLGGRAHLAPAPHFPPSDRPPRLQHLRHERARLRVPTPGARPPKLGDKLLGRLALLPCRGGGSQVGGVEPLDSRARAQPLPLRPRVHLPLELAQQRRRPRRSATRLRAEAAGRERECVGQLHGVEERLVRPLTFEGRHRMRCVADQRHAAVTPTRSCEGCSALGEGVALPAVVDGVRRDVARRRVQQQRRRGLVPVLAAAAHLSQQRADVVAIRRRLHLGASKAELPKGRRGGRAAAAAERHRVQPRPAPVQHLEGGPVAERVAAASDPEDDQHAEVPLARVVDVS